MPFKSKAQAAYLYINHPDIAKRWQSESPVRIKKLPDHVAPAAKAKLSGKEK